MNYCKGRAQGMDWHRLYFGHVSPQEVAEAVRDAGWQHLRLKLKGLPTDYKWSFLNYYYNSESRRIRDDNTVSEASKAHALRMLQVRVTNYVTALSRGGIIKPEDYRS